MNQDKAHYSAMDDTALVVAIADGQEPALAAFYDRHASIVLALCIRILKDRPLAEEVLDDVFWELWNHSDRYVRERSSPRTYLLILARSRAIDRLRSERTARAKVNRTIIDSDPITSHGSKLEDGPAQNVVNKELQLHMQKALQELDANKRQALELSFFDGLSHKEIAQQLDQPLGTVKTRIRAGLTQMRQALRNYYSREDQP